MCLSTLVIAVVDKSYLGNPSLPSPPLSKVYLLLQKKENKNACPAILLVIFCHMDYLLWKR